MTTEGQESDEKNVQSGSQAVQSQLQDIPYIILQSHHHTYLRSNENCSVDLAPHSKEYEKWQLISLPNTDNKFCFKSIHNTYLRANKNGTIDCAPHCQAWEQWTKVIHGDTNTYSWKSHHGTYLRGNKNNSVDSAVKHCKSWEEWRIVVASSNEIINIIMNQKDLTSLESCHHKGKYLRGNRDDSVDLVGHCQSYEKWKIINLGNGKYCFRSHHGKYLRGNKNGSVDCGALKVDKWEEWTMESNPQDGSFSWKSYHGNYLRGNKNGSVDLAPHCKEWEKWKQKKHN